MGVPRMRGLREAVNELHEIDSGCALSFYALRCLVLSGVIPCVRIGRRILVDMDTLCAYLRAPAAQPTEPVGRIVMPVKL